MTQLLRKVDRDTIKQICFAFNCDLLRWEIIRDEVHGRFCTEQNIDFGAFVLYQNGLVTIFIDSFAGGWTPVLPIDEAISFLKEQKWLLEYPDIAELDVKTYSFRLDAGNGWANIRVNTIFHEGQEWSIRVVQDVAGSGNPSIFYYDVPGFNKPVRHAVTCCGTNHSIQHGTSVFDKSFYTKGNWYLSFEESRVA